MRLYLVRHGQTTMNEKGCYYGQIDAGLTREGIRQARELEQYLGRVAFDHVFTSPLSRAKETAGWILGDRRDMIRTDPGLSEHSFGIFEGKTFHEIETGYPRECRLWMEDYQGYRIPQGESFLDVRSRVEDFYRRLPKGEGTALIVAHKGTFGHLLSVMLKMPPEGYWNFVFDQGCYSVVDLEDDYAIIRKLNAASPAEDLRPAD